MRMKLKIIVFLVLNSVVFTMCAVFDITDIAKLSAMLHAIDGVLEE